MAAVLHRNRGVTRVFPWVLVCGLVLGMTAAAEAVPISFSAANGGSGLSAHVTFADSGGNLIVTLTNTSLQDVTEPAQLLTGLFFKVNGTDPTLTPVSAFLGPTSFVTGAPNAPAGGNVGGEWAYTTDTTQYQTNQGIASAGYGIFGDANFNGPDLSNPLAVNGFNYAITSAGDNPNTGNGGVLSSGGLIQNQVKFTLSGWSGSAADRITKVVFQYGTSLSEPRLNGTSGVGVEAQTPVPEPTSMLLLGSGLGLAALRARRRRKREGQGPSVFTVQRQD